jgi:hypothetical protein
MAVPKVRGGETGVGEKDQVGHLALPLNVQEDEADLEHCAVFVMQGEFEHPDEALGTWL